MPLATPVTTPVVGFTVATAVLLLLQVPPVPVVVKVLVAPVHIAVTPPIVPALGAGVTVSGEVAEAVPQAVVTV